MRNFREGTITEETALLYSVNKSAIRKSIDVAQKEMGTTDADPTAFKLMPHAEHKTPPPVPAPASVPLPKAYVPGA